MIRLSKFSASDFETFKSWISNEKELYQFAGPMFVFPLTDKQLNAYIVENKLTPLKVSLQSNNEYIGHCELNFKNKTPRLSRILIGKKALRGKGIGTAIVKEMCLFLFEDETVHKVDLNVFEWNKSAIKSYENVGFVINKENTTPFKAGNKIWKRLHMELQRIDWKNKKQTNI